MTKSKLIISKSNGTNSLFTISVNVGMPNTFTAYFKELRISPSNNLDCPHRMTCDGAIITLTDEDLEHVFREYLRYNTYIVNGDIGKKKTA